MEEHLLLYLILMWQIILPQVKSQAPGDEDSFCTTLSASIVPPSYPSNFMILLDSYNYINLLPVFTPNSGVWQQVDIDGRLGGNGGTTSVGSYIQLLNDSDEITLSLSVLFYVLYSGSK